MRLSTLASVRLPIFSVRIMASVLREQGIETKDIFRAAGLKDDPLEPAATLEPAQELAFQRGFVAATAQRRDLWFDAGTRYHVLAFAEYGLTVITSRSFQDAVLDSLRDDLSYSLAHFTPIEVDGVILGIEGDLSEVPSELLDFQIYRDLGAIFVGFSEVWNGPFPFARIEVPLPAPADTGFLARLGRVPEFGSPRLAYHWGAEVHARKPLHSDPVLHGYYESAWASLMPGGQDADDLIGSVALELALAAGEQPNLGQLAKRMGYSERTLQRRLRQRGITFREVTAEARKQLSIKLLRTTQSPISEIAWRLGYAEVASFTHAFRRWTGQSPHRYRVSKRLDAEGERPLQ